MSPGQVWGVILAAGTGSRLGGPVKQLLPVSGIPLLQRVLDLATLSGFDDTVLVLGHAWDRIIAEVDPGPARILFNPAYEEGMSTSLRVAIQALPPQVDAIVVLLGDQPGIDVAVIRSLMDMYRSNGCAIVVPRYRGSRGNPVLIDRGLFAKMLALEGDTGARALMTAHTDVTCFVDVDLPAPRDVDTPDDYAVIEGADPDQTL
jgi:molybdenum cofactor cytidylyltransferase